MMPSSVHTPNVGSFVRMPSGTADYVEIPGGVSDYVTLGQFNRPGRTTGVMAPGLGQVGGGGDILQQVVDLASKAAVVGVGVIGGLYAYHRWLK